MPRNTIKALVIDAYISEGKMPDYETLTATVLANFPNSKWQKSHYAWYKAKIKSGEIEIPGLEVAAANDGEIPDTESDIEEAVDAAVSLERDLHDYLVTRLAEIEPGLTMVENGREYRTDAGNVDILAKSSQGELVVVELKAGKAKDNAIGQLLGYIGSLSTRPEKVRGILVASEFDPRVIYAARAIPHLKLYKYALNFKFDAI
jgi:RecB family endonuclease NucS